MADPKSPQQTSSRSRRDFLKTSSAVGAALAGSLAVPRAVHAGVDQTLKVGLIGCGGRGTGAAANALQADPHTKLVAMADTFADRIAESKDSLKKVAGNRFAVTDETTFVGFDAYQKLLQTDVDVVILAEPPHFRPVHLRAAIEAGKHVFAEKPIAVDAPGVRSVIETSELAREKGLSIVSGLCWRYDEGVRATMDQIHGGAIGDIVAIQANYLAATLWHRGNKPEWSRMEYQVRNWLYYTWLSGDINVEQHIHSLDKTAWLLGDQHPLRATGMGGRAQRTDANKWGHIYDHHAVVYEYPGDVRVFAYCRQQDGCDGDVDEYVMGTKGQARILKHHVKGKTNWRYKGPKPNMYVVEHEKLFAGIRSSSPINNGHYMCNSTMIAIMGRMCTYTGKSLTWEQCLNSQEKLGPDKYEWSDVPEPSVPVPGITQFA